VVYHSDYTDATYYQTLNTTNAQNSVPAVWNSTAPSSTNISLGSNLAVNSNNVSHIAYAFHSVDGYSRIGSYTGTGASNSIVTGFRPAYVMIKKTNNTGSWTIIDNKRDSSNPIEKFLKANDSSSEGTASNYADFNSNGFTLNTSSGNNSGDTFIYLAFAEENVQPEPELANSFNVVTYTGTSGTQSITGVGFQPDLVWAKNRTAGVTAHILSDSVRGIKQLTSSGTDAEGSNTNMITSYDSDGFGVGDAYGLCNGNGYNFVAWCWKASNDSTINQDGSITSIVSANPAAGFSVVKYTGNNTAGATIGHGLNSTPDLIIVKNLDTTDVWTVQHSSLGYTNYIDLSSTNAATVNSSVWYAEPTSSTFSFGANPRGNGNGNEHIAYCFHSVAGYQKIGSYTGNGGTLNVTTGFAPRFVMLKPSSLADNWMIYDTSRGKDIVLFPNLSNADTTYAGRFSFLSDGFQLSTSNSGWNGNGSTYIYLAIA